jgi:excisionase family DNA binding protein
METHAVSSGLLLPRLAYSLAESEALSGLSRSSLYRMIAAGTLRTVVHGRRRLVPAHELERLFSAIEVEQRIPRTAAGAKAMESAQ